MDEIWRILKEMYNHNPTLFGILLFIDLTIIYFLIKHLIS